MGHLKRVYPKEFVGFLDKNMLFLRNFNFAGWFFKVFLKTALISTVLQLQGRDPDIKLRINLLYTPIGNLGGVKKVI